MQLHASDELLSQILNFVSGEKAFDCKGIQFCQGVQKRGLSSISTQDSPQENYGQNCVMVLQR